jgi:pimeloyl-ACP methyl ester carboxylesterase
MKKYVHFRGKKIFYSERGSGRAIVLVHGYLESSAVFDSFTTRLATKYRVISIDLPGHGSSDVYSEIHSMEFFAGVIDGLLQTLGIEKALVAGHSFGGYVTLAFLDVYSHRLAGYCLLHSHPFPDTSENIKKREREILLAMAGKKFLFYPDNIKMMFADMNLLAMYEDLERSKKIASEISTEGITAALRGMMQRSSRQAHMELGRVPCLWVLGAHDKYINCEVMKGRVKLPPSASLLILEKSGHLGFIEEEEKTAEALLGFADSLAWPK